MNLYLIKKFYINSNVTVHSNGAKEVVTTVVTTTSPHTSSDYNMTKYQIHSEKIILITEFSTNQYKNIQVFRQLGME
jgi:hypothetical protein